MNEPFNKEEKEIMELMVKAHNIFVKLPNKHPHENMEWTDSFHRLQSLLGDRVLRRDYPETFTNYKN